MYCRQQRQSSKFEQRFVKQRTNTVLFENAALKHCPIFFPKVLLENYVCKSNQAIILAA
jgi:hypothetical protein